ncbi:hypothetical protein J2Z42_001243 [Clostridium algifaecis]|uniref:Uncharacterized protein n=1 Tax=Clostridium algifaecis TaxID=1472040 RepID=A0ABS4KT61_9CLOT|nr:hypothetical protein [Clostridium algifaecis]
MDYDLADIGSRLGSWTRSGSDSMLDDWYNKYGDYFSS